MTLYLLHGDDAFALAEARGKLEKQLVDPAWASFNLTELPGDVPIGKMIQCLLAVPFGGGARVVIIKEPQFLLGKVEDSGLGEFERLLEQGLPARAELILSCAKVDSRLKLVKKLLETATVREFAAPKPWQVEEQLSPWVERLVKERQRKIDDHALSALLAGTGRDRFRIAQEVEKLTIAVPEGDTITVDLVRKLVAGGDIEIFALTEAIARREPGTALGAIGKLLTSDHPLKVIAAATTILRGWWRLKAYAEAGTPINVIAREIGARSDFKIKKDLEMLRSWNAGQLGLALEALGEVDQALKSGRWSPEHHQTLIERAIAKMLAA